ncbi:MAG: HAD family hydrolase [Planctomycetes bacterium]|nr:HAD family hydrolase [Planctomycetota bacterium]MCB9934630.1 HAD family hydrolase [Planctomycetota bacterium]
MLSHIDTVLFDLDGTLTVPVIDFDSLRNRLGLPHGVSITHALNALPEAERERGFEIVREAELEAARLAKAAHGAVELIHWLHGSGFATGIITRNFRAAVDLTLQALGLEFDVIITRDCAPPKPAPDALLEALRRLGRGPETTLMVGDFRDDMDAGRAAGTLTCLVTNGEPEPRFEADLAVPWLEDLLALLKAARKK